MTPDTIGLAPLEASPDESRELAGAVVLGGDYQGLGIVRSLGRRKVPTCVIDDESSIARFSRYATHAERVPSLRDDEQILERVLEIGRRLDLRNWVLFPTRDEMVAALARNRETLTQFFRVPTPTWKSVQWVWDKRNTYRLAGELGIPIPKTWYPQDVRDLDQIREDPPLAIKPAIKEHFFYTTRAKAWRANNRRELGELFLRAAVQTPPGEVMIQELIPGGGQQQFAYCCFFKEGRALASMVVKRRRQHPLEFGRASTFVETVEVPVIEELSELFLRSINYYGLAELEYKLDPRDGQYKLLDVNARTWGYHTLGPRAGVDFPYLLFADQTNQDVEPCRGSPGIRWIRLLTDLPTGVLEMLEGRQSAGMYLRSVAGAHVEAVFSTDDLLPGLAELALLPYLFVKRGF